MSHFSEWKGTNVMAVGRGVHSLVQQLCSVPARQLARALMQAHSPTSALRLLRDIRALYMQAASIMLAARTARQRGQIRQQIRKRLAPEHGRLRSQFQKLVTQQEALHALLAERARKRPPRKKRSPQ